MTPSAQRHPAPLAVATDGTVFINVNVLDAIDHADLAGRRLFIGAALTTAESQTAREILDNAGHELRAKIAGRLRSLSSRKKGTVEQATADEAK